jgi:rRNA-processing protein FCF1
VKIILFELLDILMRIVDRFMTSCVIENLLILKEHLDIFKISNFVSFHNKTKLCISKYVIMEIKKQFMYRVPPKKKTSP